MTVGAVLACGCALHVLELAWGTSYAGAQTLGRCDRPRQPRRLHRLIAPNTHSRIERKGIMFNSENGNKLFAAAFSLVLSAVAFATAILPASPNGVIV